MRKVYFSNFCEQIYAKLDDLISNRILDDSNVILFGMNSSSIVIAKYLEKRGIHIAAYIDNNEKKIEESTDLVPVMKPDSMKKLYGDKVRILIMSKYYEEMKNQLIELGYSVEKHIYRVLDAKNLEQYVDFSDVEGMRQIEVKELRRVQMDLLNVTKKICTENNLRFYLTGGTLLGAIRHNGYIPWDDDIDIVMPMKDYKQFMDIINSSTEYTMVSAYNNREGFFGFFGRLIAPGTCIKTWDYPYMATIGINIDIFPLYGVPDDMDEANKFADKMERLNTELSAEFIEHEDLTERYFELQKQILDMMDYYDFDDSHNIAYLLSRHKKKEIMPRSLYSETVMRKFEEEEYPVPGGYNEYLIRLFGEKYMELPEEKDRQSVHNYKAFVER